MTSLILLLVVSTLVVTIWLPLLVYWCVKLGTAGFIRARYKSRVYKYNGNCANSLDHVSKRSKNYDNESEA